MDFQDLILRAALFSVVWIQNSLQDSWDSVVHVWHSICFRQGSFHLQVVAPYLAYNENVADVPRHVFLSILSHQWFILWMLT
jgi:hypothetical protein